MGSAVEVLKRKDRWRGEREYMTRNEAEECNFTSEVWANYKVGRDEITWQW